MFDQRFFKLSLVAIGMLTLTGLRSSNYAHSDSYESPLPDLQHTACLRRFIIDQYGEEAWQEASDGTVTVNILLNEWDMWSQENQC